MRHDQGCNQLESAQGGLETVHQKGQKKETSKQYWYLKAPQNGTIGKRRNGTGQTEGGQK